MRTVRPVDEMKRLVLVAALATDERGEHAFRAWREQVDLQTLDDASIRMLPHLQRYLADDALATQIRRVLRMTWLQTNLMIAAAARVAASLNDVGVPTMITKGAAVLSHSGWDVARRPMNDIDLAVPFEHLSAAVLAVRSCGFDSPLADMLISDPDAITRTVHAVGFVDRNGAQIDLHWSLLKDSVRPGADKAFWANSGTAMLRDQPVRVTSREDTLLNVIANGWIPSEASSLQWATDAVSLVGSGDIDWDRVESQARSHRLSDLVADALDVLEEFGPSPGAIPRPVRRRLKMRGLMSHRPPWPAKFTDAAFAAAHETPHGERVSIRRVRKADLVLRAELMNASPKDATPVRVGAQVTFGVGPDGRSSPYLVSGWHYSEVNHTWSRCRSATIVLPLAGPTEGELLVECRFVPFVTPASPQRSFEFHIEGATPVITSCSTRSQPPVGILLRVPARPARQDIRILVRVNSPISPRDAGFNGDPRRLGLAIVDLTVLPSASASE